jgi:hypothetical protein
MVCRKCTLCKGSVFKTVMAFISRVKQLQNYICLTREIKVMTLLNIYVTGNFLN